MLKALRYNANPRVIIDLGLTEIRIAIVGKIHYCLPVPTACWDCAGQLNVSAVMAILQTPRLDVPMTKSYLYFLIHPFLSKEEKASLMDIGLKLGAKRVQCLFRPQAQLYSLVRDDLPPVAFVVDIGATKMVISLIKEGEIIHCHQLHLGSHSLDEAMVAYLRRNLSITLPLNVAEQIKKMEGLQSADNKQFIQISGIESEKGWRMTQAMTVQEKREAWAAVLSAWVEGIRTVLYQTPVEWVEYIKKEGIYITGGGAALNGLEQYFSQALNLCVTLIEPPIQSALMGAEKWIQECNL